jgi:hypothetical protein
MKALVFQGRVIEKNETGFPVAPDMQWVDVSDDIDVGYSYDGINFKKPVPIIELEPTPDPIKARLDALEAKVDLIERETLIERRERI